MPGPVKAAPAGGCADLDRPSKPRLEPPVVGCKQGAGNGHVRKSAIDRQAEHVESEDELVARIASDRRAGNDTTKDVATLLGRVGKENEAALDRLAK